MDSNVAKKIQEAFSKYPARTYPKGQILIFANEDPAYIFYLVKGRVREYDVSYRGDEVIVNLFKPCAFFPMSWAINHSPNHYFYKAETETVVHLVPVEDALAFLKTNSDVAFDLLSRLYRGMDGLLGRVAHLMSGTARSRLIYELIIECRRFGKQAQNGGYTLQLNESDFAARSGLSRETVSREMHKLKDRNWVVVTPKAIIIKDLPALEAALGTEI
jgi:CRP/FNR family transcriptional regulator